MLAGGLSSRLGTNKALVRLGRQTLIGRAVVFLESIASRVSVVGLSKSEHRLDVPTIADQVPNCGPIGGIASALEEARAEWTLILACDMPYLTPEFLRFLRDRAPLAGPEIQAVVPETQLGLEPLCAIYRKSTGPVFKAALTAKKLKLTSLVATLRLDRIPESEWRPFSLDGKLFESINRPEDLEAAREAIER